MIGIGKTIILFMLSYGVMCDLYQSPIARGTDKAAVAAPCPAGYDKIFTDDTGRRVNVIGDNVIIDGQIISINEGWRSDDGTVEFRKPKGETVKGNMACIARY